MQGQTVAVRHLSHTVEVCQGSAVHSECAKALQVAASTLSGKFWPTIDGITLTGSTAMVISFLVSCNLAENGCRLDVAKRLLTPLVSYCHYQLRPAKPAQWEEFCSNCRALAEQLFMQGIQMTH